MEKIFLDTPIEVLIILAANVFVLFIMFIMILVNRSKVKKMNYKYNKFMRGLSDRNIEELIENYIERVNGVTEKNKEIENHMNNIERSLIKCIQKVGSVRYNAFENVGSDLSFVIALMDNNEDGFLVNGIYSRDTSSVYCKPLIGGKSRIPLSSEEMQAIKVARKANME